MKRVLSLILAVSLVLSFPTFANQAPALTSVGTISEDGQTVTVVINISGSNAVCSCSLDLVYDPSLLTYQSITAGSAITDTLFVINENYDTNAIRIAWLSPTGFPSDGEVATITFSTRPTEQEQISQLQLANAEAFDMSSSSVAISAGGTSVTLPATEGFAPPDAPLPVPPNDNEPEAPVRPIVPDPDTPSGNYEGNLITPNPPSEGSEDPEVFLMTFTDVSADAYYYDAVCWAVAKGITSGTSADAFSPAAPCTRAQTVALLWRAAGCPQPAYSGSKFTDVSPDAYYHDAVLWAVEQGITAGTSSTTFSPDAVVNRAQVVTFLWRYAGWHVLTTDAVFADVPAGSYFERAVHWAVEYKITNGTSPTSFGPDGNCTRAQIATFLYRYFNEH